MKPFQILARVINYKLSRYGLLAPRLPINLTFSVTHKCQSHCQTCNIGEFSRVHPENQSQELSLPEIEKIFQSMGEVHFFNVSGGCPFLRKELSEIVRLAVKYLKPSVIHISTNALMIQETVEQTLTILNIIKERDITLQLKPSLDGIGEKHDKIRGVKGNFKKVEQLLEELKKIKRHNGKLHIGLGTVISELNIDSLPSILSYVEKSDVDSYIAEIAEIRTEMFNREMTLTPSAEEYNKVRPLLIEMARNCRTGKNRLVRLTQSFREIYYHMVYDILRDKNLVIPCYGGISNAHINAYGEVWPCCVLGYDKPMGNLRDADYNFNAIWRSQEAKKIRRYIFDANCYCPLANQAYANILCNEKKLFQAICKFIM